MNWNFSYYLKNPCDPAPGSANVTVTPKPRDIIVTQIICDTRDNPLLWNLTLPPHPEHLAQSAKVLLVYQLDIPQVESGGTSGPHIFGDPKIKCYICSINADHIIISQPYF